MFIVLGFVCFCQNNSNMFLNTQHTDTQADRRGVVAWLWCELQCKRHSSVTLCFAFTLHLLLLLLAFCFGSDRMICIQAKSTFLWKTVNSLFACVNYSDSFLCAHNCHDVSTFWWRKVSLITDDDLDVRELTNRQRHKTRYSMYYVLL